MQSEGFKLVYLATLVSCTNKWFKKLATECNENQVCKVFIWNQLMKTCQLLESLSNLTVIEDALSIIGPRNCSMIEEVWPEFKDAFIGQVTDTMSR
jgi:hypothetical protein